MDPSLACFFWSSSSSFLFFADCFSSMYRFNDEDLEAFCGEIFFWRIVLKSCRCKWKDNQIQILTWPLGFNNEYAQKSIFCFCFCIYVFTFSILDSCRVSLKLGGGIGVKPVLQTNNFLRRKEIDFFPIAFFLLSAQMSLHLPMIRLMVLSISSSLSSESLESGLLILLSTSKLEGQLRNLSNGRSATCFSAFGFRDKSFVNSFCSLPTSSGEKSTISSEEDGFSSSISRLSESSLISLLPNVPIASNPWGQSLNSSRDSCFLWSAKLGERTYSIYKQWSDKYLPRPRCDIKYKRTKNV